MNDFATQLMARERRQQFLSSALAGGSDIDARPLLRTALGLASGLVWAIVITTTVLVIEMRGSMIGIDQLATQASASESAAQTTPGNGQKELAKNSVSHEGRPISFVSDAQRTLDKVQR